ncbi:MAG: DUF6305 family protein [Bacillota bacterium]
MKKTALILLFAAIFLLYNPALIEASQDFSEPILVTSAGQSPDAQMARAILARIGLDHEFEELISADEIEEDTETFVIVVGGSSKGLGAAGLDEDEEMDRIEELLKAIKDREINLIAMHLGGESRRGAISDPFIELVFPEADYLIVYEEGDEEDRLMREIAEENDIELTYVDKVANSEEPLKDVFNVDE